MQQDDLVMNMSDELDEMDLDDVEETEDNELEENGMRIKDEDDDAVPLEEERE